MVVGGSYRFGMGLSRSGLHGKTRSLTLGKRSAVRVACHDENCGAIASSGYDTTTRATSLQLVSPACKNGLLFPKIPGTIQTINNPLTLFLVTSPGHLNPISQQPFQRSSSSPASAE